MVERRTGTPLTQVRFPGAAREFSPFQCRLSNGVRTPPRAIACINIYVHVNDPVVTARDRWSTETLKHPACTVDWVSRLCAAGFPRGKQRDFPMGEIPMGQCSCLKKRKKKNTYTQTVLYRGRRSPMYFTAISVHRNIVLYCNISTQEHGKLIRVQVLHWDTSISSIFTLKGRHERCIQQQKTHNGEDNIYWC